MKKYISMVLSVLFVLLALCSCGNNGATGSIGENGLLSQSIFSSSEKKYENIIHINVQDDDVYFPIYVYKIKSATVEDCSIRYRGNSEFYDKDEVNVTEMVFRSASILSSLVIDRCSYWFDQDGKTVSGQLTQICLEPEYECISSVKKDGDSIIADGVSSDSSDRVCINPRIGTLSIDIPYSRAVIQCYDAETVKRYKELAVKSLVS